MCQEKECRATASAPFVCDTGTREHTNIERTTEIAGVTPTLKFGAGGRLFCSRWPAFPLAGGRLTSRGIRFCCRWPTFPFIENASDQAGNLQTGNRCLAAVHQNTETDKNYERKSTHIMAPELVTSLYSLEAGNPALPASTAYRSDKTLAACTAFAVRYAHDRMI